MSIETRCAGCGKIVRIDEKYAGVRARCTACGAEFTVPHASDDEALDSVCHYCGVAMERGEQSDAEFKACSECQQSIDENLRELEEERRVHRLLGDRAYVLIGGVLLAIITIYLSIESMFR